MHRSGRPERRTIPLNLIVDGRSVLVVGGGRVGLRKTRLLLEAGARVELVCPAAVDELAELAAAGKVAWTRRPWQAGDAAGHLLAFACTDDKHVNRAVLDDARLAHVPCCCADLNWSDGDFTTPATARVGDLTIAVSTSGLNCAAARDAKREILSSLDERRDLELRVIGTSDALLPSRKRAPFHLPAAERAALGPLLSRIRGVREFFILNTCNRVELVVVAGRDEGIMAILKRLIGFDKLSEGEYFLLSGFEAFRHLARVASGLESSLLGEFHVVSQMKDALDEAEAQHWSGPAIRFTGNEVMRVSKAVRHAVEGMLRVAEIDQIAVRYLTIHGGLDAHASVMVIGTGVVGRGAVEGLARIGCRVTWVYHANRPDPAALLAPEAAACVAEVVPLTDLAGALKRTDVVLSAVDSSRPVVTPEMGPAVADRNVLFVDLGVPRNVDPAFDEWGHGVTVADLDDLKLWHRVKTGTLQEVLAKADETIRNEYRAMV